MGFAVALMTFFLFKLWSFKACTGNMGHYRTARAVYFFLHFRGEESDSARWTRLARQRGVQKRWDNASGEEAGLKASQHILVSRMPLYIVYILATPQPSVPHLTWEVSLLTDLVGNRKRAISIATLFYHWKSEKLEKSG